VHLQVENTRRCCGAVARGEADLALVGGVMPPDLEHLLQVRRRDLVLSLTPAPRRQHAPAGGSHASARLRPDGDGALLLGAGSVPSPVVPATGSLGPGRHRERQAPGACCALRTAYLCSVTPCA